ncbi:MAG: hypothetical protein MJZ25_09335 [Fibrobacter sp.]|nr:hypothetical protein [Fibrobacter sp.]
MKCHPGFYTFIYKNGRIVCHGNSPNHLRNGRIHEIQSKFALIFRPPLGKKQQKHHKTGFFQTWSTKKRMLEQKSLSVRLNRHGRPARDIEKQPNLSCLPKLQNTLLKKQVFFLNSDKSLANM